MRTQSNDTPPAIERVQIELLRQAGMAKRFARARALTCTTFELAFRALRRRHPELGEDELFVLFVELNYGKDLATRLRRDLQRRGRLP